MTYAGNLDVDLWLLYNFVFMAKVSVFLESITDPMSVVINSD